MTLDDHRPSRTADATPRASALIESLRDIGYSLDSALADIVDNSITAGARGVHVLSDTAADEPVVAVLDDGRGMTEAELIEAMRPGSRHPGERREGHDLGRFGLGLKSASFSQCRRLTVVSRKDGVLSGAAWDLDEVARTDRWDIEVLDTFNGVPWIDRLGPDHGTLVLWQRLDRMTGGAVHDHNRRIENLNHLLAGAERHLRLVFHRYMEDHRSPLAILLNGRVLEPLDPFASGHPAGQAMPEEVLTLAKGDVIIRGYVLPHHKSMARTEWDELGGPEGHLRSQGFWVYRERRLIIAGSWFGLARQAELTKLSRIRVDIPNSMDPDWKIDVKKASAQLPPIVRERLRKVVERFAEVSRRTYTRRGSKLVDEARIPLWVRIPKDGAIIYRPNVDHPALLEFCERLPVDLRAGFDNCVALLGASLPVDALHADMAGSAEAVRAAEASPEAIEQAIEAMVPMLMARGLGLGTIKDMLRGTEPFRSAWSAAERIIDRMMGEEVAG